MLLLSNGTETAVSDTHDSKNIKNKDEVIIYDAHRTTLNNT